TFAALGARVHLICGSRVLLPFLDSQISQALAESMQRREVTIHWNERVESCVAREPDPIAVTLSSGERLEVDAVLVAAGRKSNTENLNLAAADVQVTDRGLIPVDEHFRTNASHIYAAGDVIGFPALASTSMQQARIAMRHAFGGDKASHA